MTGLIISLLALASFVWFIWACLTAPIADENGRVIKSNVVQLSEFRKRRAA